MELMSSRRCLRLCASGPQVFGLLEIAQDDLRGLLDSTAIGVHDDAPKLPHKGASLVKLFLNTCGIGVRACHFARLKAAKTLVANRGEHFGCGDEPEDAVWFDVEKLVGRL